VISAGAQLLPVHAASSSAVLSAWGRGDRGERTTASAVVQDSDAWQRRVGEPLLFVRYCARLEAELLDAAQHLGDADRSGTELMIDLFRIRTDA
jgi:hypothetical protein